MSNLFTFLQTYRSGILLLLFALIVLTGVIQWLAWIFGKGRFGKDMTAGSKALSVAISEAIFKIINEFRHLLALLVFMVFSFALAYALIKAASLQADTNSTVINNMKEALQGVVATLGGLVGSIIGYYFGESSARGSSTTADTAGAKTAPAIQSAEGAEDDSIRTAERPKGGES